MLDLTQYLAGPACTRLLAEMGAEVIKVEAAPFGDPSRAFTPRRNRRAGFFVQQHRGKQSICLDLRSDDGVVELPGCPHDGEPDLLAVLPGPDDGNSADNAEDLVRSTCRSSHGVGRSGSR